MAIEQELKDRARELYVFDGLTLDQVAKETGIPESTVKRWSAEDGWADERREHKATLQDIRRNTLQLRKAFVAKAMGSLDPQDVYAAVRLEALAQRGAKKEEQVAQAEIDRPKVFLENLQWIAGWLKENDPDGLKVLAVNIDAMTEAFKAECLKHGNA
jgi:transcriptional regulator with XRE-family HTH domain